MKSTDTPKGSPLRGRSEPRWKSAQPREEAQGLLVAVDDPATGQVVRAELDDDPVVREDPDVVHPHLAGDVRQDLVPVRQLNAEHRVGQGLDDGALDLDGAFFFGQVPSISL